MMLNYLRVEHPLFAAGVFPSQQPGGRKQQTLFRAPSAHFTPEKSERLTELITDMIAVDLWRISVVERQGFNRVISFLTGGKYTMRARSSFTNRLKKKFEQSKENLKKTRKEEQIISVTTDSWTSLKTDSYWTVMGTSSTTSGNSNNALGRRSFLATGTLEKILRRT